MKTSYVHGYTTRENIRLQDQASTLVELLHSDTAYPAGSRILEAGCGVGAQTITLAENSPDAKIIAVDISATSVARAKRKVAAAGFSKVHLVGTSTGRRQASSSQRRRAGSMPARRPLALSTRCDS